MKTLFENNGFSARKQFAEKIVEHNGYKFRIHVEADDGCPCASVGSDWEHSLSVMKADGTWGQIADARTVGAPYTHHDFYHAKTDVRSGMWDVECAAFESYIKKVY